MNELTQRGIAALKAGDRAAARKLFASALQQDSQDAKIWLWLAASVDTEGQQIDCLRQVLRLDPGNELASKRLSLLLNQLKAASAPPTAAGTPAPETQNHLATEQKKAEEQPADGSEDTHPPAESPVSSQPLRAADYLARKQESATVGEAPAAEEIHEKAPVIFKTRPSQVPALLGFWVIFFGVIIVGGQLAPLRYIGLAFSAGLWLILEISVLYVVIQNFRTRYELTEESLNLRSAPLARRLKVTLRKGGWLNIPILDIVHLETRRSRFQQLIGTGDILLDAAVNGVLTQLQLRSIPDLDKRARQIKSLMEEQDHVAV
jgi:hypothetical protein